jgi:hypothetical protein
MASGDLVKEKADVSILLVVDPSKTYMVPDERFGGAMLEEAVRAVLHGECFEIFDRSNELNFLGLVDRLYPEESKAGFRETIKGLRTQVIKEKPHLISNRAIAYVVSSVYGNTVESLSNLVGPTMPEDFMSRDCLRRLFAGRFYYKTDSGLYRQISPELALQYRADPVHKDRVAFLNHVHRPKMDELARDAQLLFSDKPEVLEKYGLAA